MSTYRPGSYAHFDTSRVLKAQKALTERSIDDTSVQLLKDNLQGHWHYLHRSMYDYLRQRMTCYHCNFAPNDPDEHDSNGSHEFSPALRVLVAVFRDWDFASESEMLQDPQGWLIRRAPVLQEVS